MSKLVIIGAGSTVFEKPGRRFASYGRFKALYHIPGGYSWQKIRNYSKTVF